MRAINYVKSAKINTVLMPKAFDHTHLSGIGARVIRENFGQLTVTRGAGVAELDWRLGR